MASSPFSAIGVIIIPALYALIYLSSVQDPGAHTGDLKAALLAMATVVAEFADAETMDSVQDCIDAAADLCDRLPIFDGYQAAVERAEDNNWCARREARRLGL